MKKFLDYLALTIVVLTVLTIVGFVVGLAGNALGWPLLLITNAAVVIIVWAFIRAGKA